MTRSPESRDGYGVGDAQLPTRPVVPAGSGDDAAASASKAQARTLAIPQGGSDAASFDSSAAFPGVGARLGPGTRLGNYELIEPLQAGGMGVVYLGRRADEVFDRHVAIKLIQPGHLHADPAFRRQLIARFESERVILARLAHPNVARILDGGSTEDGIPYLVMEFVDGEPLHRYCITNGLGVRERLALFCKVCAGVQEAHRNLIVHRDLKPDNVLVGSDGEPRLLDFGIAKILEEDSAGKGSLATGISAMTPAYASPEQVRNERLTTSSDVYSLGVVLYELLTGVRPYELAGLRPAEAERLVCETAPEPMRRGLERAALTDGERRQRRAQLGDDLERIVAKALHKEPGRRYRSAQDLADDIQRYLDGRPVLAHPDSGLYRASKFFRRHVLASTAAVLALVAVLAAAAIALQQAAEARAAVGDTELVNRFLLDVLADSDPFEAGGELSLSEAVFRAADQIDERFAGRPRVSAPIRYALGYSLMSRYRLESAEPLLLQALADYRQAHGEDHVSTYLVREAIASLRQEQGDFAASEAEYESLLADLKAAGHEATQVYGLALGNLGNLYLAQGDYAKADIALRRALDWERQTGMQRSEADMIALMSNLARAAHELGEIERADTLYLEALERDAALRPKGSLEASTLLNNRAHLLMETDRAEAAMEHWQRALAMREAILVDDHPMRLGVMLHLVYHSLRLDRIDYGLAMAGKAVAMAERLGEGQRAQLAKALALQAALLSDLGDGEGAERSLQRAEQEHALWLSEPGAAPVEEVQAVRTRLCRAASPPLPAACEAAGD